MLPVASASEGSGKEILRTVPTGKKSACTLITGIMPTAAKTGKNEKRSGGTAPSISWDAADEQIVLIAKMRVESRSPYVGAIQNPELSPEFGGRDA